MTTSQVFKNPDCVRKSWVFCFKKSPETYAFLTSISNTRDKGVFLGVTWPDKYQLLCGSPALRDAVVASMQAAGLLEYQQAVWISGDLLENEVDIETFQQPFVQWCPSLVFSQTYQQSLFTKEPWGLTMEGEVVLSTEIRGTVAYSLSGLSKKAEINYGDGLFDVYDVDLVISAEKYQSEDKQPIRLICDDIPAADIFKLDSGEIICSNRFAQFLKKDWLGFVYSKFQPVVCVRVSEQLIKRNRAKIKVEQKAVNHETSLDLAQIEQLFGIQFPAKYKKWVVQCAGKLPYGWLSPKGGKESELVLRARQEWKDSEPSMPDNLMPLYACGDGDYIAFVITNKKFVLWEHETGEYQPSVQNFPPA